MSSGSWVAEVVAVRRLSRPPQTGSESQRCIPKELIMATDVFPLEGRKLAKEQWQLSIICCALLYLKGIWLRDHVSES